MSRQKRGLRLEHELAQEIFEATGGRVIPLRSGWSGNQGVPSPDLLIPLNGTLRAVELKSSNRKRMTITPDDVSDIEWWVSNQKEVPTVGYLAVKFSYWQVYVAPLPGLVENTTMAFTKWAERAPFDTNVTKKGNLTIGNPSHYDVDWVSSRKSEGDGISIVNQLSKDSHSNLVSVTDILKESDNYWPT